MNWKSGLQEKRFRLFDKYVYLYWRSKLAYTFFPKTATEIKQKLRGDKVKIDEIIAVFAFLKNKFKKVATPINIDPTSPTSISKINITRELQGDIDLAEIKKATKFTKITMKFGSGSSGGRGVQNKGNAYEGQLAEAIQKWWNGEKNSDVKLQTAVDELAKLHNLKKYKSLEVKMVGELNNKRPFVFTPSVLISSKIPVINNNLGPVVTDITLVCDKKKEIYLSLKTGGTVTFFNSGIRTVLSPQEIKTGRITNKDGLKILDMFNINDALFCDIFNGNLKSGYNEDIWKTMSAKQKRDLKEFLKSGVGHGYTIVHKMTNTTHVYNVDEKYMDEAATPKSCTVYYGGKTGTGKRIDMEIETGHYILKLNMRDTQGGDGYPTRMMCDYSYK